MTFTAVLGIILFSLFLTEKKEKVSNELEKNIQKNKENISANTKIINKHKE